MNLRKEIKVLFFTVLTAASAINVQAQDVLAKQAPVDTKSKSLDSMAVREVITRENFVNPSSNLYEDFDTKKTHVTMAVPNEVVIDLRGFTMPTTSRVITSNFGRRWHRMHKGLDIKVYIGDSIRSAFDGKVRIVKYEKNGYGNYIVVRHNNGLETYYAHLSKQLVKPGQIVRSGEVIGLGGNTGRSTGSHLHFETRICGKAINPALMFDFRAQDVTGDTYTYRSSTYERDSEVATATRGKNVNSNSSNVTSNNNRSSKSARTSYSKSGKRNTGNYVVKRGDNLYRIARRNNMSVSDLKRKNGWKGNHTIKPGQRIKI